MVSFTHGENILELDNHYVAAENMNEIHENNTVQKQLSLSIQIIPLVQISIEKQQFILSQWNNE